MDEAKNNATSSSSNLSPTSNLLVIGSGQLDLAQEHTELIMPNGRVVRLPTSLLAPGATAPSTELATIPEDLLTPDVSDSVTIPLIEERLVVSKRTVPTGTVRLRKTAEEHQQTVQEFLAMRTYEVERVAMNRPTEKMLEVRQEGNTTVYPVIEERLILVKQLVLVEEIRVSLRETQRVDNQSVTLRRERLEVEKAPLENSDVNG